MLGVENLKQHLDLNWLLQGGQNLQQQPNSKNLANNLQDIKIQQNEIKIKKPSVKEIQKKQIKELYDDKKLNDLDFHSLQTFKNILKNELDIDYDGYKASAPFVHDYSAEKQEIGQVIDQIFKQNESKIKLWIEKNKSNGGFIYQAQNTRQRDELNYPPVRCDLCKYYGHLSHTCTIKDLAFKLNNSVLRNNACRCHICGMLGHSAESGLCPFIICSFCYQNGHWNFMCPHKDKISRTNCTRCLKYGHRLEQCPEQWRQFDRISSHEQTTFKDPNITNKNVYCYQCAQKGHYGYNCPEFYRKYFIRDYHHMDNNPVYYFASASPFIKQEQDLNDIDIKIIDELQDKLIDERLFIYLKHQESISLLNDFELFKQQQQQNNKVQNEHSTNNQNSPLINDFFKNNNKTNTNDLNSLLNMNNTNDVNNQQLNNDHIFNDTHWILPLKEYIRKISHWVIDVHWILVLKYFIDTLPTHKLEKFLSVYPTLDNFILNWMYYSYTISNNLEQYTKDPFASCGTMPWLLIDYESRLNTAGKSLFFLLNNSLNQTYAYNLFKQSQQNQQLSRYFQYNESTIKLVNSLLFPNESNASLVSESVHNFPNNNTSRSHHNHHHREGHLLNRHKIQSECLLSSLLTSSSASSGGDESLENLSVGNLITESASCLLTVDKHHARDLSIKKQQSKKRAKSCDTFLSFKSNDNYACSDSCRNGLNQTSKTEHNSPMISSRSSTLLWKKTASELQELKNSNSYFSSLHASDDTEGNNWDGSNQDNTVVFDLGGYDIRDELVEKRRATTNFFDVNAKNSLECIESSNGPCNAQQNNNNNLINIMNLLKTSDSESDGYGSNKSEITQRDNEQSTNALKSLLKINTFNKSQHSQQQQQQQQDSINKCVQIKEDEQQPESRLTRPQSNHEIKHNNCGFYRNYNQNNTNNNNGRNYFHRTSQNAYHHNKENHHFKYNNNGNSHKYSNSLHVNTNTSTRVSNGLASASSSGSNQSSIKSTSQNADNNGLSRQRHYSNNTWNNSNQNSSTYNGNSDTNDMDSLSTYNKKSYSYNGKFKHKNNFNSYKKHHSSSKY